MLQRPHTCGEKNTVEPLGPGSLQLHCLVLALLVSTSASSGKLDEVRDATDDGGGGSGSDASGDDSGDESSGLGGELAGAAGEAFMDALVSAASARAAAVRFERYPYADGADGWLALAEDAAPDGPLAPEELALLPRVSFRFSLEYAYDWERVHRPAASLALDTSSGFGLRADYTNYVERLPAGRLDYLGIGTLDALFRMLDARRVALHLGLGWRYLVDRGALRNGFNSLLSLDVFPVRPIVLSAIAEGGNLGAAGFFRGRLAFGALVQRLEIFAGYDAVVFGPGGEDPIVFHGPVVGIRGWL